MCVSILTTCVYPSSLHVCIHPHYMCVSILTTCVYPSSLHVFAILFTQQTRYVAVAFPSSKLEMCQCWKLKNILRISYSDITLNVGQNIKLLPNIIRLCSCTMHVDNIKSYICPTNAHNSYKVVKLLKKSFEIVIVAPTCFGLHKPSSGNSQPVLRWSYNVDFGYIYCYLKLSLLWLHILFSPVMRVDRALCTVHDPHT